MQQSLNTIPVIFGYAPNSTAALLSKAVQVDKTAFRDSFSFDELEMERLGEWTSFPITSSAGEVLGTFDLFVFDGVRFDVSPDAISNFLFVASVLLERHQALSTIVNQARADRLIKRIGENCCRRTPAANSRCCITASMTCRLTPSWLPVGWA